MKQTLGQKLVRTISAMKRTETDSGIDVCHIQTVIEALAEIKRLELEIESYKEVASVAQGILTALNAAGAVQQESPLHKHLRKTMIQHRETLDSGTAKGANP